MNQLTNGGHGVLVCGMLPLVHHPGSKLAPAVLQFAAIPQRRDLLRDQAGWRAIWSSLCSQWPHQKPIVTPLGPSSTLSWGNLFQEQKGPLGWSWWGVFPTCPLSSSPQPPVQTILGIPLPLQRSRWVLCPYTLMVSVYTVHQRLPKPYTSVGLMCQAIESTQSGTPSHPFPPRGWRQGCSVLVPRQNIHSDPCGGRPEVPSPASREVISILLCLGDRWWPCCVSPATTLTTFLDGPWQLSSLSVCVDGLLA